MSADFEINLKDGVSDPADSMLSKIAGLDTGLGQLGDKGSVVGDMLKSIGGGAGESATGLDSLADGFMQSAAGEAMLEALDPVTLIAGIAAAAAAAATAIVGLVIAGAKLALTFAQAKAQLMATMTGLTGSAAAAQGTIEMMDRLAASTGLTRAQLTPFVEELAALKLTGAALEEQLKAVAAAQALGMGGEQTYLDLIKKVNQHLPVQTRALADLYKMGINVSDIAKQMGISTATLEAQLKKGTVNAQAFNDALSKLVQAKGAAALEAQSLSLANQWERLKELVGELFEDVDISGFLKGIKSVIDLFDTSNASGRALKAGITATFNAIFHVAQMVFPWIKKAIELVIIAGLKIYIAFKPVIQTFKDLFKNGAPNVNWLYFFQHGLGGIVTIAGVVAKGIMLIINVVKGVIAVFKGGATAAKNLIDGLVNGIKGGTGLVIDAIKGLGKGAMNALKSMLGIASPSKEFTKLGQHVGAGFAVGLDGSHVAVANASQRMGAAAAGPAVQAAAPIKGANDNVGASKGGGGKTVQVTFQPGSVVVQGASAQSAQELSEHTLALAFERVKLVLGAG